MMFQKKNTPQSTSKYPSKLDDRTWKDTGFAARLRARREELNLSQENLAKDIGVSNTTVQNYESGQYPKGEYAIGLAQALQCSLDWLLMGRGPMRPGEAATSGHINRDILYDVVETLEEFLQEWGRELPPRAKAEVIYQLYEMVLEDEDAAKKPARILRLIKGALAANE